MGQLGDLVVKIVGDTADFVRKVEGSSRKMSQFDRDVKRIARGMARAGRTLTMGITLPIVGLGAAAIKSAADLELQSAAFETMLGSAEDAALMIQRLTDMAAMTPFQMTDLADGTKTLLAFGVEADNVLPVLKELGDISLGDSQRLGQLALVYGQVQSAGRLMGQDLLQLINVGFNPLQIISEQTGETMAELKDRMSEGAISAEEVAQAFTLATSEGGLFFGGMERASQTLAGKFSTLKDNVAILGRSFAEILLPSLKNIVDAATDMVQRWAEMDTGTRRTILVVSGLAAAVGPLLIMLSKLPAIIGGIKAALALLAAPPAGAIVLAITAVAALTAGIVLLIRRKREYERLLYDTANAVRTLSKEEQEAARSRFMEDRVETARQLREDTDLLNRTEEEYNDLMERRATLNRAQLTQLGNLITMRDNASTRVENNRQRLSDLLSAIQEIEDAWDEEQVALEANQEAFDDTTVSAEELLAGLNDLGDGAEETTSAIEGLTEAVRLYGEQEEGTTGAFVGAANVRARVANAERTERERLNAERLAGMALMEEEENNFTGTSTAQRIALYRNLSGAVSDNTQSVEVDNAAWTQWEEDVTGAVVSVRNAVARLATDAEAQQTAWEKFADWYETNYADRIIDATQRMADAIIGISGARAEAEIANIEASAASEEEKDALILDIKRKQARREKTLGIFNATIDTAQAIIGFLADPGGIAGVVLSVLAGITGGAQIAAIAAQPLPAMAQGGIVTGPTQALIGEGGQPELILPLDQLGDLMSARGNFSDVGGGQTHVVVNLDGQTLLDFTGNAAKDGRLLIDARAVV